LILNGCIVVVVIFAFIINTIVGDGIMISHH
jgi:hypothetical protein